MGCTNCGGIIHGATGLVRAAIASVTGVGGVTLAVLNERVRVCMACEHYGAGWTCAECGCILNAKLKLADESCPIGKWQAEKNPDRA